MISRPNLLVGGIIALLGAGQTWAETAAIPCSADTTLFETIEGNNLGAYTHVAAGTTAVGKKTRGLFQFDLAGKIPPGAAVTAASVRLKVTFTPGDIPPAVNYGLHRMLVPWVEGTGIAGGNSGRPALDGETTWTWRSKPLPWSAPGGRSGVDFAAAPSASTRVGGVGEYAFSSPALAEDVKIWLGDPNKNFGWLLLSASEEINQSAKRFGSRESGASGPVLLVEYTTAAPELRFTGIERRGENLLLSWSGGSAPYQLEKKERLEDIGWMSYGAPVGGSSTEIPASARHEFFRVASGVPAAPAEAMADYDLLFEANWTASTHPDDFPIGAHWSGLVGGTHNARTNFWLPGRIASDGIKDMAELGAKTRLMNEVNEAIGAGAAREVLSGPGISGGAGTAAMSVTMHRDFPLLTITSMLAPSPDWFVGVSGLNLIENGQWARERVVTLYLYDAGTDGGASYRSADAPLSPRLAVRQISGFPARVNGVIVPFGTLRLIRK